MRKGLILFVALVFSSFSFAKDGKVAPDLSSNRPEAVVNVIVQYNVPPAQKHKSLIQLHHGKVREELALVNAIAASLPAAEAWQLAQDPDVAYISPDRGITPSMNNASVAVMANYAWSLGYDGTGIGVAVLDTGIHAVNDLKDSTGKSRIVYSKDMTGKSLTDDQYGHGSHVAGIIGGSGKDSTCASCDVTIKGIAPNVKLVNLRVLDATGAGSDSSVINAITQAISLKATYNIRVMNLSLGRPVYESYTLDPLCQAVEAAWKAGIVVVVAAGDRKSVV